MKPWQLYQLDRERYDDDEDVLNQVGSCVRLHHGGLVDDLYSHLRNLALGEHWGHQTRGLRHHYHQPQHLHNHHHHHLCQDQAKIAMVGWRETSWVGTGLTCIERKWKSSKYPNISPYGASKRSPPSTNKPKTITAIKKTGGQHKHETSSRSKYLFSCWPTNETQPTPGKGIITS